MKTKIAVIAVLLLGSAGAYADDQSSGCGLGWQVFKKNSLVSSYSRNFTNVLASNTFAMTSGTSGCAKHSIVLREKAAEHFAEANYQKLQTELAEGQGEHLTAFADILGCKGDIGSLLQKNYENIFPTDQVKPSQMLEQVKQNLRQSKVSCAVNG